MYKVVTAVCFIKKTIGNKLILVSGGWLHSEYYAARRTFTFMCVWIPVIL